MGSSVEAKARRAAYMRAWRQNNLNLARASERAAWARNGHKRNAARRARGATDPAYVAARKARVAKAYKDNPAKAVQARARTKAWRLANQVKYRDLKLRTTYGISLAGFEAMAVAQDHCCAICGVHEAACYRGLHVDHCHQTGRVRGLLCRNCNIAAGLLSDDPGMARQLAAYLEARL